MAKKKKKHIGEIYYVDPKHLVKPSNRNSYNSKRNPNNKRPVMVGEEKNNKIVQVSQITTVSPTHKQIRRNYMVEMDKMPAPNGNPNYIDTRTISKSRHTNKKFKIGESPLVKSSSKATEEIIKKYQNARKKRYSNKK